MALLQIKPVYQQRVWGGQALQEQFGRTLPTGQPIGESWEIVDRPEVNRTESSGELR